jgi:hypothetical protein
VTTRGEEPFGILQGILSRVDEPASVALSALEHTPDPWESWMQATSECLSWRGALGDLERRHAEDRLGTSLYREFPVRSRPAVVVAHLLLEKGVISESELQAKINEVRSRLEMADAECPRPG